MTCCTLQFGVYTMCRVAHVARWKQYTWMFHPAGAHGHDCKPPSISFWLSVHTRRSGLYPKFLTPYLSIFFLFFFTPTLIDSFKALNEYIYLYIYIWVPYITIYMYMYIYIYGYVRNSLLGRYKCFMDIGAKEGVGIIIHTSPLCVNCTGSRESKKSSIHTGSANK